MQIILRLVWNLCKQKSAELRGDLVKEVKLANGEGFIGNQSVEGMGGPSTQFGEVHPFYLSASLTVDLMHDSRLTCHASSNVDPCADADIGA